MSKINKRDLFEYKLLDYKFNRHHRIILLDKTQPRKSDGSYVSYTFDELGNEGWELITKVENKQKIFANTEQNNDDEDKEFVTNRTMIFMRLKT
jgi:hypothetical protein